MRSDYREFLRYVNDESIREAFDALQSVDMKVEALSELLRAAQNREDVDEFDSEFSNLFDTFFLKVLQLLPDSVGEEYLWDFALPHMNLMVGAPPEINDITFKWKMTRSYDEVREESALKMFGYTTGRKGRDLGWDTMRRQEFLSDFMTMELPKEIVQEFGEDYAVPSSSPRLNAVASHIRSVRDGARRKQGPNMIMAIKDWTDDLEFLKRRFYDKDAQRSFAWRG